MPTDDRRPPRPPRGDGRTQPGATDPAAARGDGYQRQNPPATYGQPRSPSTYQSGAHPSGPHPSGTYPSGTYPSQAPYQSGGAYQPGGAHEPAPYEPAPYGPSTYGSAAQGLAAHGSATYGSAARGNQPHTRPGREAPAPPRPRRGGSETVTPRRGPIRSHGRRKRRISIIAIVILVLGVTVVGAGLRFLPGSPFAPVTAGGPGSGEEEPTPTPTPTPDPLPFAAAEISAASLNTSGFLSWALMDRRSGEIWGSANMTAMSTTMSMIKAWVAADYLRLNPNPTSSRLRDLEKMVRDSDNPAAERIYVASGRAESIKRLIKLCDLTNSKPPASGYGFGYTQVSAQDAVRMGDCIADGRAAGEEWTPKVLEWMRGVRGVGDFGIRKALPAAQQAEVAIKNGWDNWSEDKTYRVSCLAIGETWVMAVLQQYPSKNLWEAELNHTAQICQDAATALLNPKATAG